VAVHILLNLLPVHLGGWFNVVLFLLLFGVALLILVFVFFYQLVLIADAFLPDEKEGLRVELVLPLQLYVDEGELFPQKPLAEVIDEQLNQGNIDISALLHWLTAWNIVSGKEVANYREVFDFCVSEALDKGNSSLLLTETIPVNLFPVLRVAAPRQFGEDEIVIIHLFVDILADIQQVDCEDEIQGRVCSQLNLLLLFHQAAVILTDFLRGSFPLDSGLDRHLS
jgi:hypothetical protein